jgi:hypothetical protein
VAKASMFCANGLPDANLSVGFLSIHFGGFQQTVNLDEHREAPRIISDEDLVLAARAVRNPRRLSPFR